MHKMDNERVVISVLGKDRPGIVAGLSSVLAVNNVNIQDITQTVLQDTFTMTMIVDMTDAITSFEDIKECLNILQDDLGIQIMMQKEEVFNYMYRL